MDEHAEKTQEKKGFGAKKFIIGIAALLVLGGGAYWAMDSGLLSNVASNPEKYVAMVNGEGIERRLFDVRFGQEKTRAEASGVVFEELHTEQLQQQVVSIMVDERLLIQHAKNQGFAASEESVEEQYQTVLAQVGSEEELKKLLEEQGATIDDVKTQIADRFMVREFAETYATEQAVEVTEEEIQQAYDEAVESGAEVGALEEVRGEIADFLRSQKIDQLLANLTAELRAQASIEVLL